MDTRELRKKILSAAICMIMAVAMVLPAGLIDVPGIESSAVYAASEKSSAETKAVTQTAAAINTAQRVTVSGYDITFNENVVTGELLGSAMSTDTLRTTGKRKSVKLKWSSVKNKKGITGYYIVRKDNSDGRWYQIASVSRDKKSYTDKTAKAKNTQYTYILVPFAEYGGYIRIAEPSSWASAVTTRSKAKNVNSLRLERAALGAAVRVGGKTKVKGHFAKTAYDRTIRWSSSDNKIAKINKKGKITGVSEGTATISARTHTGYVLNFDIVVVEGGTARGMVDVMRSWMDYSYYNRKNRGIVDIYNSFDYGSCGYKMQYYDAWCDCTVSAAAYVSGNTDKIGKECSVPRHIEVFKKMGIWIEGRKTVPQPGDLVVFNWYPKSKKNASHIGIVESVDGNTVTTIEGNMGVGKVSSRTYPVGWKYIRGYARPNYKLDAPEEEDTAETTGTTKN